MEGSGTGISRLDCYEDMFKEITRKLYGEDPDHRTSSVQNEFEASVSYKNDEDTGNGTDGSDDGNWTCEDEPLKGTDGSRIAAYHAGKSTWRCYECGDVMSGGPREAAEHFMELHSSRILADDGRNRQHSSRKDYLHSDLKVEDVVSYLERLRERAERGAPPSRRTQETQTVPAALLPVTSTFLLQELPSAPVPQHLHQNTTTMPTSAATSANNKRYTCPYCPYGTDRRDLYTRHENIHREEKPFHCYVCFKPFNRADHVKKHFLRMHREHGYELSRIRRAPGTTTPKPVQQDSAATSPTATNVNGQQAQQPHTSYQPAFNSNKGYQLPPNAGTGTSTGAAIYQATTMPAPGIMQPDASNCATNRRVQNGGCNSKSHTKGGSKNVQERRYTCCYCSWSGVDNWCLKRHLNTHLKPFTCTLCEYKAARAERLSTHVLKVHNRRQCSRCSFLGEDISQLQMHQMHVHRVGNANTSATSTTTTAPPPSNRHQQPLHPSGGGRPPPGPPVFPAPAPAIAPATTVIPPTTILGHEMVKSPATAATMAYPTEEEKRSYCRINGINDEDDHVVRDNGNQSSAEEHSRDQGACRVCAFKGERNDYLEPCSDHSTRCSIKGGSDISNNNFTCSYHLMLAIKAGDVHPHMIAPILEGSRVLRLHEEQEAERLRKRCRKQSKPRRVMQELTKGKDNLKSSVNSQKSKQIDVRRKYLCNKLKKLYEEKKANGELQKCHLCPKDTLARGRRYKLYHNKTSLLLHKMWRHQRRSAYKNRPFKADLSQPVSSITLKATVFTRTNYDYRG